MDNELKQKKIEWFDQSSLCCYARCPRRYFFKHILSLTKPGNIHPALSFGSGIHAAFPCIHKGDQTGAYNAFMIAWLEEQSPPYEDPKRNPTVALSLIQYLIERHKKGKGIYHPIDPPSTKIQIEDSVSPSEIPFAFDVGAPVPIIGRVDALARHRDTGELWGVEYKTTSQLSSFFMSSFSLSPQLLTYFIALNTMSLDDIKGMILESVLVAKTKADSLITFNRFSEKIVSNYIKWASLTIQRALLSEEQNNWPQHFTGCNSYSSYGLAGFNCEYIDLCQAEDYESLLGLFEVRPWKPYSLSNLDKIEEK